MAQDVQVQSGIGLGMKIAAGFVLFFCVITGGTCAACTGCSALGIGGLAAAAMMDAGVAKPNVVAKHAADAGHH